MNPVRCETCGYAYDCDKGGCPNPVCRANPNADPAAIAISEERHRRLAEEEAERERIRRIRSQYT